MTAESEYHLALKLIGFSALSLCGLFVCSPLALAEASPSVKGTSKVPILIEVQDAQGVRIASSGAHARSSKAGSVKLTFDREYLPGDRLIIGGPERMALQVDANIPECLVYFSAPGSGNASYEIPYGREEKQTGSAYAPESFAGKSHRVSVRALNKTELTGYRNLAMNPCDLRETEPVPVKI